jgi:hypothetical protein
LQQRLVSEAAVLERGEVFEHNEAFYREGATRAADPAIRVGQHIACVPDVREKVKRSLRL